jgi:Xaa-Pro aminopeptidase
MTAQALQQRSDNIRRAASQAYRHERVTMRRREMERETEAEIRAAIRESIGNGYDRGSSYAVTVEVRRG